MTATPHQPGLPSLNMTGSSGGNVGGSGPAASRSGKARYRKGAFPQQPKSVRFWNVHPAGPDEQAPVNSARLDGPRQSLGYRGYAWLVLAVLLGILAYVAVRGGWLEGLNLLAR